MATTFTDKKGRVWDLELDLLACRRIDSSDFTLYYPKPFSILQLEPAMLQALIAKPALIFAIIWAIVKPQALEKYPKDFPEDAEKAELEFVSGIGSSARAEGQKALFEALGDFFPELKTALSTCDRHLRTLQQKINKQVEETGALLDQMIDDDLPAAVEAVRERLKKTRDEKLGEMLSSLPQ